MDQRLSMVMVGAKDVAALRTFYEQGLGWVSWGPASGQSVMYKLGATVLVFLDARYLAAESGLPVSAQPKSLWAIFMNSKAEVDAAFARAVGAGGTVTSPVRDRHLGIYSGYFMDPEGNGWEIAWSPTMPLDAGGELASGR